MLAFAHTIQRAIDRGEIRDQADAARRLGVTRARMTQILDLTLLAPDLQEEILFSETTGAFDSLGGESLAGTTLRKAVRATSWLQQRQHLRQRSP
jgi:lipoprotein NlpI